MTIRTNTIGFIAVMTSFALSGCQVMEPPPEPATPPDTSAPATASVGVYIDGPDAGENQCAVNWHFIYDASVQPHSANLSLVLARHSDGKEIDWIDITPAEFPSGYGTENIYGTVETIEHSTLSIPCSDLFGIVRVVCVTGDCPAYVPWQHPQGYEYSVPVTVE